MGVNFRKINVGEVQPQCSDCGIGLCWSIDIDEYNSYKEFWDNWCCQDCNPDYKGAYRKYIKNIQKSLEY